MPSIHHTAVHAITAELTIDCCKSYHFSLFDRKACYIYNQQCLLRQASLLRLLIIDLNCMAVLLLIQATEFMIFAWQIIKQRRKKIPHIYSTWASKQLPSNHPEHPRKHANSHSEDLSDHPLHHIVTGQQSLNPLNLSKQTDQCCVSL